MWKHNRTPEEIDEEIARQEVISRKSEEANREKSVNILFVIFFIGAALLRHVSVIAFIVCMSGAFAMALLQVKASPLMYWGLAGIALLNILPLMGVHF